MCDRRLHSPRCRREKLIVDRAEASPRCRLKRVKSSRVLTQSAQSVQRKHVRSSLPDRQNLGVTQEHWQASVFNVTRPAKGLERFTSDGHDLFASREFHQGSKEPQKRRLRFINLPRLATPG